MTEHIHRHIGKQITRALSETPVVCLLGPRQSGKTTIARKILPDSKYFTLDEAEDKHSAKYDPRGITDISKNTIIIDEVQLFPELLRAIKISVDEDRRPGRFLITGSANLLTIPKSMESLAGRVEHVHLQPLSEFEKRGSTGKSLLEMLVTGAVETSIKNGRESFAKDLANAIVSGGYPEAISLKSKTSSRRWMITYLNTIISHDVRHVGDIRESGKLYDLLTILANRTGGLLSIRNLSRKHNLRMKEETVEKYMIILGNLFLTRKLPAWNSENAKRMIRSPKIHIVDSGLASFLHRQSANNWLKPSGKSGSILESFAIQQLICQSDWLDEYFEFSHFRTKDGMEVDLVIEEFDRLWGVEIKKSKGIDSHDKIGLSKLAKFAGNRWQGGMILYSGNDCVRLKEPSNTYAVPLSWLWQPKQEELDLFSR